MLGKKLLLNLSVPHLKEANCLKALDSATDIGFIVSHSKSSEEVLSQWNIRCKV